MEPARGVLSGRIASAIEHPPEKAASSEPARQPFFGLIDYVGEAGGKKKVVLRDPLRMVMVEASACGKRRAPDARTVGRHTRDPSCGWVTAEVHSRGSTGAAQLPALLQSPVTH